MAEIDLIVPTIPGREESLGRCLESFEKLTAADLDEIVVTDSETCGHGWKLGLEQSEAPYVLLVADDIECASKQWAGVCMGLADEGLLPCPRVWKPDGSVESQGGDMNVFRHIHTRHRKHRAPTDFTVVPFMSREQADAIGMIEVQYGSDTWVSYRGRQLGHETVLAHGFDLTHWHEQTGRGAGMGQQERDEMDTQTMFAELEKSCA